MKNFVTSALLKSTKKVSCFRVRMIKFTFINILYIKFILISNHYIKNTNETTSIIVVFRAIENILNSCCKQFTFCTVSDKTLPTRVLNST